MTLWPHTRQERQPLDRNGLIWIALGAVGLLGCIVVLLVATDWLTT